ncbi:MAG: long-chain fatty acid--CoA ligase [Burkholderiales bacterium]|nr:long-chain fatty acid--CoA ligase [Burkholderiales bacterium]
MSSTHTAQTLPELFAQRVAATPQADAYRQFDAGAGQWRTVSWQQTDALVARWRRALLALHLDAGARVAILVPNGLDHVCMDLAALSLGLVPVPMHAVDNPGSIAYILQDSDAAMLLVDSVERWQGIAGTGTPTPGLQRVVVLDAPAMALPETGLLTTLADWLTAGDQVTEAPLPSVSPEAMAAIVYTSGTTGRPKGVMLSHRNVVSNIRAVLARFEVIEGDLLLSFLPLSHTFERTVGYYLPIAAGACVAFARSVALLQEDLRTVRPTVLVSVPRIYERIYAKVQETLRDGSPMSRKLLQWAQAIGWQNFLARQGRGTFGVGERLAWQVLRPLVAQRVLDTFGGRLRIAVAGGAPLSGTVAHFFLGLGLDLLQGYGMTETSPVVSCNTPTDNEPSSIGRALPGVQVRIGENGELMVAGPSVMMGYWKRPEDTQRTLEPDGWLHTGDQAKIVDGRLYIVGRIKDIIVTSTGEKIPPSDLELAIQGDPLFSQVLVIGEQRPFLSVLAVVDNTTWQIAAVKAGLDPSQPDALNSAAAEAIALQRIATQVHTFPSYAMPKRVWLTHEAWTIDAGLMTPTLKLKRPALEKRFASQIETLYKKR